VVDPVRENLKETFACCDLQDLLVSHPITTETGIRRVCVLCQRCGKWGAWRYIPGSLKPPMLEDGSHVSKRPHPSYRFPVRIHWKDIARYWRDHLGKVD
jgi:hypothetical protein